MGTFQNTVTLIEENRSLNTAELIPVLRMTTKLARIR